MLTNILLLLSASLAVVSEAGLAGGITEHCVADNSQHAPAIKAINRLVNKGANNAYYQRVGTVHCIKTQVVAGTNYYIEADLIHTTCRRGDDSVTLEDCPEKEGTEGQRCNFELWERAWLENPDEKQILTKQECKPKKPKKDVQGDEPKTLVGGERSVEDVESSEVQDAAEQSAILLRQKSNSYAVQRIAKIVSAKKQTVAGVLWTFDYYFGKTKCTQNQVDLTKAVDATKCPFDKTSNIERCTVKLLHQAWKQNNRPYTLSEHSCRPASWDQV